MLITAALIAIAMTEAPATRSPVYADRAANLAAAPVIKVVMMMDGVDRAAPQTMTALRALPVARAAAAYLDARVIRTVPRALASTAIPTAANARKVV